MNDLLRLNNTVRRDPRIEDWFFEDADPLRLATRSWFERMRDCGPDVREVLHAAVGFFYGAMLADPAHLLEGEGKRMRHVKLRPGQERDENALGDLIAAAYDDIKRRLTAVSKKT